MLRRRRWKNGKTVPGIQQRCKRRDNVTTRPSAGSCRFGLAEFQLQRCSRRRHWSCVTRRRACGLVRPRADELTLTHGPRLQGWRKTGFSGALQLFSTVFLLREGQKQTSTPLMCRIVELVFLRCFLPSLPLASPAGWMVVRSGVSSVPAWCGITPISEIAHVVSSEVPPRDEGR